MHDAQSMLTVSDEKEEPPFLGKFAENHDEHEVEHHSLTHHPAEGRQEQILKQSCHCSTNNLWSRTMHDDPQSCVMETQVCRKFIINNLKRAIIYTSRLTEIRVPNSIPVMNVT